jgi:glutathione S-transferase
MVERILYEFPHSHFCEKARWALDFKGLAFKRVALFPPWHVLTTRRYGKYSSVPLLLDGEKAVQGSGKIITYLDDVYPDFLLTKGDKAESDRLEKYFDNEIGVHLRAFFYYYCLKHKNFVQFAFMQNSPSWQKVVFNLQYPVLAQMIKKSYCPTEDSAHLAGKSLLTALEHVWEKLNGRPYLLPEGFSRLDLTICSLLSFVARPAELPIAWPDFPDDAFLIDWYQRLQAHPLIPWVLGIYKNHRNSQTF